MNKPPKYPYHKSHYIRRKDGQMFFTLSGRFITEMVALFQPSPEETRVMLLKLREHCKLTQSLMAAFLGVPVVTIRKWEDGERNPSGAARKLIWLLYETLLNTGRVTSALDIAFWGDPGIQNSGLHGGSSVKRENIEPDTVNS